jgi:hypothetical protein
MVRDANIFMLAATKIKPLGAKHLKESGTQLLFVERRLYEWLSDCRRRLHCTLE